MPAQDFPHLELPLLGHVTHLDAVGNKLPWPSLWESQADSRAVALLACPKVPGSSPCIPAGLASVAASHPMSCLEALPARFSGPAHQRCTAAACRALHLKAPAWSSQIQSLLTNVDQLPSWRPLTLASLTHLELRGCPTTSLGQGLREVPLQLRSLHTSSAPGNLRLADCPKLHRLQQWLPGGLQRW